MSTDHRTHSIEPDCWSELELDRGDINRWTSSAAGHMDACCDVVQQCERRSFVGEWDVDWFIGAVRLCAVDSSEHDLAGQLAEWTIGLCDWCDFFWSILWNVR